MAAQSVISLSPLLSWSGALRDATGQWHDVAKAPVTDPAKGSKAGRQTVVHGACGLVAARLDATAPGEDLLIPVWRNGELLVRHTFDELRAQSEQGL